MSCILLVSWTGPRSCKCTLRRKTKTKGVKWSKLTPPQPEADIPWHWAWQYCVSFSSPWALKESEAPFKAKWSLVWCFGMRWFTLICNRASCIAARKNECMMRSVIVWGNAVWAGWPQQTACKATWLPKVSTPANKTTTQPKRNPTGTGYCLFTAYCKFSNMLERGECLRRRWVRCEIKFLWSSFAWPSLCSGYNPGVHGMLTALIGFQPSCYWRIIHEWTPESLYDSNKKPFEEVFLGGKCTDWAL